MGRGRRTYDPADIAARLQSVRLERGWTHHVLGLAAGFPASQVAAYLCGSRPLGLTNLVRLATALDVSLDWLVGRSATREIAAPAATARGSASDVTGDPPGSGDVAGLVLDSVQTTRAVELSEPDTAVPTSRPSGSLTIAN